MTSIPKVPEIPDVVPMSWDDTVYGITISVAPTDTLGFPMSKRGVHVGIPLDKSQHKKFAKEFGKMAEGTVLQILGVVDDG